jgi:hypothetical protein
VTGVDQNLSYADYTPLPIFNALTGEPVTVYNLNASAVGRAVNNLDRLDPEREQIYDAFGVQFNWRPGRGAQIFGGFGYERELQVNCTNPDDPNEQIFCDDRVNDIPWKKGLKLAGSYPMPWGITLSGSLQNNESPTPTTVATTRNMVITRASRYPASCPAPCPAGQLIAPTLNQSTLTIPVVPTRASFVERIVQLDLKASKTFRINRVTVSPTVEAFNINNSDAIISYQSVNSLAAAYLAPNSIMQGRMIGVGAQVKW